MCPRKARKAFPEEQIRQTFDFSAVGGSVAPPKPQYGDGTTPAHGAVKDEDGSDEEDQSQRQVGTSAAAAGVKHDQVKEEPASTMSSLTGKGIEKPLQWKRKKKVGWVCVKQLRALVDSSNFRSRSRGTRSEPSRMEVSSQVGP